MGGESESFKFSGLVVTEIFVLVRVDLLVRLQYLVVYDLVSRVYSHTREASDVKFQSILSMYRSIRELIVCPIICTCGRQQLYPIRAVIDCSPKM